MGLLGFPQERAKRKKGGIGGTRFVVRILIIRLPRKRKRKKTGRTNV